MAFLPSARSISEIRAPQDGLEPSTDSASALATDSSPSLRLIRAAVRRRQQSSHSRDSLSIMSRDSLSGKSMNMNLWARANLTASCLRFERKRWYSLSFGSQFLSAHQSAALLCHSLRVSVSALWVNHAFVSGLMLRRPLSSNGRRLGMSESKSLRETGHLRTMKLPMRSLSFFGRDHSVAEQQ